MSAGYRIGLFLGRHKWWTAAALAAGAAAFLVSPSPMPPAVEAPLAVPVAGAQAPELTEAERMASMSPAALSELLQAEMLAICQAANPSLNYIKAVRRGPGLYCVHDFYSRYSLSSGPLASLLNEYASRRSAELRRLKITRIGAWGTGEYASGSWLHLR